MSNEVNLKKGYGKNTINLTKTKPGLTDFCVGVNWGMKITKGFLGFGTKKEKIDLDIACAVYDSKGSELEKIYFSHANLKGTGIQHSGDDRGGDVTNDGIDNEIISVDLSKVLSNATEIVFVLNSFIEGQDFHVCPYANIRLFKGTFKKVEEVVATFSVASDPIYKNKRAMILGKLIKIENEWQFRAIGEVTNDNSLYSTLATVRRSHLG